MADLLALSSQWGARKEDRTALAPLLPFPAVLEDSWLRRGIQRDAFLRELLQGLHQRRLIPLLAMLPRGWRLAPAALPEKLRGLGSLLEEGLVSPTLLAALADDLQHLLPAGDPDSASGTTALSRWTARQVVNPEDGSRQALPQSLQQWQELAHQPAPEPTPWPPAKAGSMAAPNLRSLGAGLTWHNQGLTPLQPAHCRQANRLLAQVFNALGANRLPDAARGATAAAVEPFQFEGVVSTAALMALLRSRGWSARARVRSSVASFGLGASTVSEDGTWHQIPLALPYRTGLLRHDLEIESLLPHCCLELELQPPEAAEPVLLQYYQGTEGLNGWAAMNDLDRPWQNDRGNGTVAYPGPAFEAEHLDLALDLCDLMAAVHNSTAAAGQLRFGGYGALGFCIDSTALLEQALTGRSTLFPLTLGGIWRERLALQLERLLDTGLSTASTSHGDEAVERYRDALQRLPQDLSLQGEAALRAEARLIRSLPTHSPFVCVRALNGEAAAETSLSDPL